MYLLEFTHFSGSGEARWIAARVGDKKNGTSPPVFGIIPSAKKQPKREVPRRE
jgi:hypothetical protein